MLLSRIARLIFNAGVFLIGRQNHGYRCSWWRRRSVLIVQQWCEILLFVTHSFKAVAAAHFVSACSFFTGLSLFAFVVSFVASGNDRHFGMPLDLLFLVFAHWWCLLLEAEYFESRLAVHEDFLSSIVGFIQFVGGTRLVFSIDLDLKLLTFRLLFFRLLGILGWRIEVPLFHVISRIPFLYQYFHHVIRRIWILRLLQLYLFQM